jgi:ferredoxin
MSLFEVNIQTCNKDGICAAVCPAGIISMQKGECPTPIAGAEDFCIRCGHCVAVCPTASFSHSEMSMEKCPPIQKELQLSIAQCEQFLRARRSIRAYKEQSVPKKELLKLVDIARYAPTGHNSQSVEWLVLGNRDELKHLAGVTVDWMRWMLENMSEIGFVLGLYWVCIGFVLGLYWV